MVKLVWFVALGGAIGSVARFLLAAFVQQRSASSFPFGTLVVNVAGSLIVGIILAYALGTSTVSAETRALLITGFCGGFTTFSTFSYETVVMLQGGDYRRALTYIAVSVVCSISAASVGMYLGQGLVSPRHAAAQPNVRSGAP